MGQQGLDVNDVGLHPVLAFHYMGQQGLDVNDVGLHPVLALRHGLHGSGDLL